MQMMESLFEQEAAAEDAPARVAERRVIPIEDVDAIWVFRRIGIERAGD